MYYLLPAVEIYRIGEAALSPLEFCAYTRNMYGLRGVNPVLNLSKKTHKSFQIGGKQKGRYTVRARAFPVQ